MKNFMIVLAAVCLLMASCAKSKTFKKANGTVVTVDPYGWFSPDDKVDSVHYQLCGENLAISILGFETIVAPVVLTGTQLYEPVRMDNAVEIPNKE